MKTYTVRIDGERKPVTVKADNWQRYGGLVRFDVGGACAHDSARTVYAVDEHRVIDIKEETA